MVINEIKQGYICNLPKRGHISHKTRRLWVKIEICLTLFAKKNLRTKVK